MNYHEGQLIFIFNRLFSFQELRHLIKHATGREKYL